MLSHIHIPQWHKWSSIVFQTLPLLVSHKYMLHWRLFLAACFRGLVIYFEHQLWWRAWTPPPATMITPNERHTTTTTTTTTTAMTPGHHYPPPTWSLFPPRGGVFASSCDLSHRGWVDCVRSNAANLTAATAVAVATMTLDDDDDDGHDDARHTQRRQRSNRHSWGKHQWRCNLRTGYQYVKQGSLHAGDRTVCWLPSMRQFSMRLNTAPVFNFFPKFVLLL